MNKRGLSMVSMLIYVVLFFTFSAFAVGMGTNMNYRTLSEKGKIINAENLQKFQFNLVNSARNSTTVEKIGEKLVFSNNDEYTFNESEKKIYKNGGLVLSDVQAFDIVYAKESDAATYARLYDREYAMINITLNKYNQETNETIFVTVGDDM